MLKIGSGTRKIGSSNRRKRKYNANTGRAFFLSLILAAVALAALAIHLTMQIASTKKSTVTVVASLGRSGNSAINAMIPPSSTKQEVSNYEAINSKSDTVSPPKSDAATLPLYPNGPKNDAKYANDRVYCMVPFIWNEEMYNVIMKTWGKRCDVINFLTDAEVMEEGGKLKGQNEIQAETFKHHSEFAEGTFPDNVHFVTMTRPWMGCTNKAGKATVCRHIWEKMWQSWIYVNDHHINEAEWFCKVDYDTFFFPENLQYYVRDYKGWDAINEHHYFGQVLAHRTPAMVAGAAACWSRKTLAAIAEVYKNMPKGHQGADRGRCEDRPEASEEISTSMCLYKELNVSAEPMRDDEMREYVMVDPYHNHLTWNRTEQGEWWFWKGKPANVGEMDDCCSVRPMGVHKYKQRSQIEVLEQQFYGTANNIEITKLKERTRRYLDKVRRAMGIDQ